MRWRPSARTSARRSCGRARASSRVRSRRWRARARGWSWATGGVGKSRLLWEFEKYVDGVSTGALWHLGRCLSYGEGVAYWALAEMVRQRLGIAEDEPAAAAAHKLADGLERWLPDAGDRDY